MRRHAHIHLPPLAPAEALRVVAILERVITAIWRAHGDLMADEAALLGIEISQDPDDIHLCDPDPDPDIDF